MTAFHIFGHNFPDSWSSEHSILPKTRAESGVDAVTTLANDQDFSVAYSIFPDLLLFSKQVRDYSDVIERRFEPRAAEAESEEKKADHQLVPK